jgi:hypothetical protein
MITPELLKLIDAVADAGTHLRIAAVQKPDERGPELERLERATAEARKLADAYKLPIHERIQIELRMCELGLVKLRKQMQDFNERKRP